MRIVAAQLNPIVGDLKGNADKIIDKITHCQSQGADIVLFSELALTGYPPEDLLLLPAFIAAAAKEITRITNATQNITAIVGFPRINPHPGEKKLYNSAAVMQNGQLMGYADKILLPTYDVFDERRYFEPAEKCYTVTIGGKKIAITICEDIWKHAGILDPSNYQRDPVAELKNEKPDLILNLSASPYSYAKFSKRLEVCLATARTLKCPVLLCNQVGANDSLIFDGHSLFVNHEGLLKCAKGFEEDELWVSLDQPIKTVSVERHDLEDLYNSLVLGVRDYFKKQGFTKACLGLSGGIDSAVVACIAADALGAENVLALMMPSRYSSGESSNDALALLKHLGLPYKTISIEGPFESYLSLLAPEFEGRQTDVTEENLQARIRGMLLMAFSNKFGYIVLSTGNKSEMAMGYATLYGDMCGGLAVLSDVTKSQVYELAEWINRRHEVIPRHTIERAPSAELRQDQKDSDSLPDYAIIDQVIQAYVENHHSPLEIAQQLCFPIQLVEDLIKRIHVNEYKRRQAPPGLRISEKAFSAGRHFPIVQKWV